MHIVTRFEEKYPKLTAWAYNNIPNLQSRKPKVWNAFVSYSELNTKAMYALSKHYLPYLDYKTMIGWGLYDSKHPNTIYLAKSVCNRFENKDWNEPSMHRFIEAAILHEIVHWGDAVDGIDQKVEEGDEFEKAAYGQVVYPYW
jgi:hypothetical protein